MRMRKKKLLQNISVKKGHYKKCVAEHLILQSSESWICFSLQASADLVINCLVSHPVCGPFLPPLPASSSFLPHLPFSPPFPTRPTPPHHTTSFTFCSIALTNMGRGGRDEEGRKRNHFRLRQARMASREEEEKTKEKKMKAFKHSLFWGGGEGGEGRKLQVPSFLHYVEVH